MATKKPVKKEVTLIRKKTSGLSMIAKGAIKKRKKHPKKKNMLSEMVSPERAKESGKAVLSGAVGGGFARIIDDKLIPVKWGNGARLLTGAISSFIVGAIFGMPNVSAGMAGGFGYAAVEKKMLADNDDMEEAEFTDVAILQEMPEYLSEDGQALMEDADGNLVSIMEAQPQYYAPYNRQM